MSVKEEQICRLCFNVPDRGFEIIDQITRTMFEVLQLEVNFDVSENPVVCQDCAEIVRKSFSFKSVYSNTNGHTFKVDLKDASEDNRVESITEDLSECRICMGFVEKSNSVPIILKEVKFREMLPILMPEMDIEMVHNCIICMSCGQNLEAYFKLATNCLDIEEKINLYLQDLRTVKVEQTNLNTISQYIKERSLKYTQIDDIKQELETFEYTENADNQICDKYIKFEETLDIKSEDLWENASDLRKDEPKVYDDHIKAQTHKCDKCDYVARLKCHLNYHTLTHKNASEVEMHKCEVCPFETKYKRNLKAHTDTHKDTSEEKRYKCAICTYQTKQNSFLKRHALIHKDASEVQTYSCEFCSFTTKYKYYLKSHILTHKDASQVETYKCEKCPYRTKRRALLNRHMLTHKDVSEVEMYTCATCAFKTKYKYHLKVHMLSHKEDSEVEMYACVKCNFKTKYKQHLKSHVLSHASKGGTYRCADCSYVTKKENLLKHHVLLHVGQA